MLVTAAPTDDEICMTPGSVPAQSGESGLLAVALQLERRLISGAAENPEVPGYEIINRLGSGASGEVWLAEELETERFVALKILHGRGNAGGLAEMLQREIQLLAKLAHPHLVSLHRGITTSSGRVGFAMEWVDGWSLDEWLKLHPDLTLGRKLQLFHGIVKGVAYLHDHGVIHRDLKPANLIVNRDGKAKIVDFGLARLHQEAADFVSNGGSIGASGTLHFMAPEQAADGDGARAMPVDVYALGLILFRILTGKWLRPVDCTPVETLAMAINPPPLILDGSSRALPRDLQSILRQTLATDPSRRYHHARELEADLDRYAARLPVAARRHTFLYLTSSLVRRQARRSALAACLVLAGLATGGLMYHRQRQVVEGNEANLRNAYVLTSFTLDQLRDELRIAVPEKNGGLLSFDGIHSYPAGGAGPVLPVDADGELDLRFYQAQLADLRSAISEVNENYRAAVKSIQTALDLYSQLARENPDDPQRLLDAAKARLSFARLLDRMERAGDAGGETLKTLRQLDRLAEWPGFDPAPLAPLRCDALRLAAKNTYRGGDPVRAVGFAREMLAIAETLPPGLLVRPEMEAAPRLALAASDLATYAIAAGPSCWKEAGRDIDRATAACRFAHEQNLDSPVGARGLAYCLYAKGKLSLRSEPSDDLRALFGEGAQLLIGDESRLRLSSFALIREYFLTTTEWTGAVMDHADPEVPKAAHDLSIRLFKHLRSNGKATDDLLLLSARLYLYKSRLSCRSHEWDKAARFASRAVRILNSRQRREPDRLCLAFLTAAALHQARELAPHDSGWNEAPHSALLEHLLQQLSARSAELSPEQRDELSSLK